MSCWGRSDRGATEAPEGRYVDVNASGSYSCAVGEDGTLSCWGSNNLGQTESPQGRFTRVDGGIVHTCALDESRELSCWGWIEPADAPAPAGRYQDVSAGGSHNCALSDEGEIVCWGWNSYGQTDAPTGRFIQVSAGTEHSCAVREDSALVCWGGDWFYGTPLARDNVAPLGPESDQPSPETSVDQVASVERVEGRIAARLLANGTIEFGFQPNGEESILPSSRFFPTNACIDRWLVSSAVEHQGEILGRITARLLEGGRVEFAFVLPHGERVLPDSRFFPSDAQVDRWLRSSALELDRP